MGTNMKLERLDQEMEAKKLEYNKTRELWLESGRTDKVLEAKVRDLMTDILDLSYAISRQGIRLK